MKATIDALNQAIPRSNEVRRRLYFVLSALIVTLVVYTCWHEKWISDDGYIYLSYVANFFERGELVFNPGEKVDAATGFVWLIFLVIAEAISPFQTLEQMTQILSLGLTAISAILLVTHLRGFVGLVTVAILFAPYFMRSFATSGLETPLIVATVIALHYSPRVLLRSVIISALPFIRPELAVVSVIYLPGLLAQGGRRAFAIVVCTGLILALARVILFGDVIPNTAFAKLGLPTFFNGRWYAIEFLLSYPLLILMVLFSAGAALVGLLRIEGRTALLKHRLIPPLLCAFVLAAYTVTSGGDFMHGRFFLPSYVFAVIFSAGAAQALLEHPLRTPLAGAGVALALLAAVPAGLLGGSFASRGPENNWWRGVMNEAVGYEVRNPNIHSWSEPNSHPWAEDGRNLAALSKFVDLPVGVATGGIGQVRMFSVPGDVYIYDLLALTQVSGTLFDQMGRSDRPGHGSGTPIEMVYAKLRVTLFHVPDERLNELLSFRYRDRQYTLGALSDIAAYVAAGLLPEGTRTAVQDRVDNILAFQPVDTRTLLYLHERYPGDGPSRGVIEALYREAATREYSFPHWYDTARPLLERADSITEGEAFSLPQRYRMLFQAGNPRPLERPYALRQAIDLSTSDCAIPMSDWVLSSQVTQEAPGSNLLEVYGANAVLSLSKSAILERCGTETQVVQLLLQPRYRLGQGVPAYTLGKSPEQRVFYGNRWSMPPEVKVSLADIEEAVVVRPILEPGTRFGLQVAAFGE